MRHWVLPRCVSVWGRELPLCLSACPTNDFAFRAFEQTHLPSADASVSYAAVSWIKTMRCNGACITDQRAVLDALIAKKCFLESIAEQLQVALLDFSQPFDLQPVFIPKPWRRRFGIPAWKRAVFHKWQQNRCHAAVLLSLAQGGGTRC
ncbi:MAG: hypothetical protein R3E67_04790 [Pseudomonadales bacterium]